MTGAYRAPVDFAEVDGELIIWLECGHARPGVYRQRDRRPARVVRRGKVTARMFCRACTRADRDP